MDIAFWNVGKELHAKKKEVIDLFCKVRKPRIFCIAEGTCSIKDCEDLELIFKKNNYQTYYTPTLISNKKLRLPYNYNRNGLKIFFASDLNLSPFKFSNQRSDGRIVYLDIAFKGRNYTLIFLHNHSKSGNREVTDQQRKTLSQLSDMIDIGKIAQGSSLIIIGDFNLEPWDNVLRNKIYVESFFINKHYSMNQRNSFLKYKRFHNPIMEEIVHNKNLNLGGTYYSNNSGWALFDFVLTETQKDISYEIVTNIGNIGLMESSLTAHKDFLKFKLDHLPILITLK